MKLRYPNGEIKLNSSYIYEKMGRLLENKVYMPIRNNWTYAHEQGYVNIFDLHQKLDHMIRTYHIPRRSNAMYTKLEKEYMEMFMKTRKINADMVL